MTSNRLVGLALFGVVAVVCANASASPDIFGIGDGHTGAGNINVVGAVINTYTHPTADTAAGAVKIPVASTAGFAVGDLILVWQDSGLAAPGSGKAGPFDISASAVGQWELARVTAIGGGALTIANGMVAAFTAAVTQVVRVPEYTDLTIRANRSITSSAWDGQQGGIVAFMATGTVTLTGDIVTDALGLRGGALINDAAGTMGCTLLDQPSPTGALKGESIVASSWGVAHSGYGNDANGGGGGICHNSGGSGGGNGGAGGRGGRTWSGDNPPSRLVGGTPSGALTFSAVNHLAHGGGGGRGYPLPPEK